MPENQEAQDPKRDPAMARLLEVVENPEATPTVLEEDALRARIVRAAQSRLDRLAGRQAAWWAPLARWTRPALPIGAAACAALLVTLVVVEPPAPDEIAVETSAEATPGTGEGWAGLLTSSDTSDPMDPAAELLAAQSRNDFLTAVLDYPMNGPGGATQ